MVLAAVTPQASLANFGVNKPRAWVGVGSVGLFGHFLSTPSLKIARRWTTFPVKSKRFVHAPAVYGNPVHLIVQVNAEEDKFLCAAFTYGFDD